LVLRGRAWAGPGRCGNSFSPLLPKLNSNEHADAAHLHLIGQLHQRQEAILRAPFSRHKKGVASAKEADALQGIVAPVEAIQMGQGQGLGFAAKERNRSPDRERSGRRRGPREDRLERPRQRSPPRRRPRLASRSR
jgi:hypothetical protein